MATIDCKPVRGTRDFYPDDMRIRTWLFDHWRRIAQRFGFEEYDACVLESQALYVRKAGDEITDQLYNLIDRSGRELALRPEMTPTLARMVIAKGGSLPLPLRWFSIPQCFRYERMQAGRKREHFQWNMDIVGLDSMAAEVELMSAQAAFLRAVGLGTDAVTFKVSNRQVVQHHLAGLGIDGATFAAVCVVIDKRDKIGDEAVLQELAGLGVAEDVSRQVLELLDVRGLDELERTVGTDNPGYRALAELMLLAEASGIGGLISIDLSVVRGLSYYTGTVWELFDGSGAIGRAIAGGGRYDALLETLGGKPQPMVGFGFGDVVITMLLEERGLLPEQGRRVDDVVYPMDAEGFVIANRIATHLRANQRRVLVDYTGRRFKHIVRIAEEVGAEHFYILGGSELAEGVVKRRSMSDRSEETVSLASVGVS